MQANPEQAAVRQVALEFIDRCFRCDAEGVLALLAPDATWWVLGQPQRLRVSGTRDRAAIERFVGKVARMFVGGMGYEIAGVTCEGERVAIEATSHARLADGRDYRNAYHFLVRVRHGRVVAMKEYLDTLYAFDIQEGLSPGGAAA